MIETAELQKYRIQFSQNRVFYQPFHNVAVSVQLWGPKEGNKLKKEATLQLASKRRMISCFLCFSSYNLKQGLFACNTFKLVS